MEQNLLHVLENIAASYPGLLTLFEAVAYVGGFGMAVLGLMRYRHGRNLGVGVGASSLASIIIGVALVNTPSAIAVVAETFFGGDQCGTYSEFYDYLSNANCASSIATLKPVVMFVQFYGFFAFLRGLFVINRAHKVGMGAQSEDLQLKGWIHIIFGMMCIYIMDISRWALNTFGFQSLPLNF